MLSLFLIGSDISPYMVEITKVPSVANMVKIAKLPYLAAKMHKHVFAVKINAKTMLKIRTNSSKR